MTTRTLKVVLVGDTQVGKSSILNRFVDENFKPETNSTIGAAFYVKLVDTQKERIRLQLWDTAGQEKYRSLAPMYYRQAQVALIVYDVTSRQSFDSIEKWRDEIEEKAQECVYIVLVANKIDCEDDRVISSNMGEAKTKELGINLYHETSAMNGTGINKMFINLCKVDLYEMEKQLKIDEPERKKCC